MATLVHAVGKPAIEPLTMPDRFRHEITYFMSVPGEERVPELAADEYWIGLDNARRWLDELVVEVISPLDSAQRAEIELSEDQERWLEWLVANGIERVRLEQPGP